MNPRQTLAEAKIALREQEQETETIKAIAETEIIAGANGDYGKNEADRKRFLTVALDQHRMYDAALDKLNAARRAVDQLGAEVAIFEDERAAERLKVLDRQAAALERLADALRSTPPMLAGALDTTEWFGK